MAVTKILPMKSLRGALNYIMANEKTAQGKYIYTHGCDSVHTAECFETVNLERKLLNSHNYSRQQYMIIQSFPLNEVDYDTAFEITKKLAEKYLGNEYQYVVVCHTDAKHVNCHIVFNATSQESLKSFDCKGLDFIWKLQQVSDNICKDYGLSVIDNKKSKGITQREYYARKHARSYKAKILDLIDDTIPKSMDFEDFLNKLGQKCEVQMTYPDGTPRKHILIKMPNQERGVRIDTLGKEDINYSISSIKYRLENKKYDSNTYQQIRYYDLNSAFFKGQNKEKLQSWAKMQNVISAMDFGTKVKELGYASYEDYKQKGETLLQDYKQLNNEIRNLDELINGKEIDQINKDINDVKACINARKVTSNSYQLITNLRKLKRGTEEYSQYRKDHINEFKEYDNAKKMLDKMKNPDATTKNKWYSVSEFEKRLEHLEEQKNILYDKIEEAKVARSTKYAEYKIVEEELFKRKGPDTYLRQIERSSKELNAKK